LTPAARIAAAAEILATLAIERRPAGDIVKDWGTRHRFAGSKDRAAIASIVYDVLRKRGSSAWVMGDDTPRALLIGTLQQGRNLALGAIEALFTGEGHALPPLTPSERTCLAAAESRLAEAPAAIRADCPDWLWPSFIRAFAEEAEREVTALAQRAATDIRANTLRTTREKLATSLAHLGPVSTPYSPWGLRFEPDADGRGPSLQMLPAFIRGHFEIQDEGSQLVALACAAEPGIQVVDLCAGGGGKTLALAAIMENRGQIYATDADARRLAPIYDRLKRADARNVQVRTPRGKLDDPLENLEGRADLVLVDAPCTGVGTWRRNPDAKWRLRPGALDLRQREQNTVLERAARLVRPGGRIVYVTCSLLPEENEDRLGVFLREKTQFGIAATRKPAASVGIVEVPIAASDGRGGSALLIGLHGMNTDRFFVATLQHRG
jgi:16S rRNA (cytosine967-C5)-methyltransferase